MLKSGGFLKRGTTKSSISVGLSIIDHPFWHIPILGKPHMILILILIHRYLIFDLSHGAQECSKEPQWDPIIVYLEEWTDLGLSENGWYHHMGVSIVMGVPKIDDFSWKIPLKDDLFGVSPISRKPQMGYFKTKYGNWMALFQSPKFQIPGSPISPCFWLIPQAAGRSTESLADECAGSPGPRPGAGL